MYSMSGRIVYLVPNTWASVGIQGVLIVPGSYSMEHYDTAAFGQFH